MKIQTVSGMHELEAMQWNALVQNNYPFLRYEFLAAAERYGSIGKNSGWIAKHIVVFDNAKNDNDKLIGDLPLYEKYNSWGEFVFDQAWAAAYARVGLEYYPKLVNAIPYTPAAGQRVLAKLIGRKTIVKNLLTYARELMHAEKFSGLHCLFVADNEFELFNQAKPAVRTDCHFHWHNQNYQCFDDFLATLTAKKRKNIRHERRKVVTAGIDIQQLNGHTATAQDWYDFVDLYHAIYERKFGAPAFGYEFFTSIAQAMPEQIVLIIARVKKIAIGAALFFLDDTTLYGRYWGCRNYVDSLHFELCYYQGIEICIKLKLTKFDPGAQGEHKIARGFTPIQTKSLHWITGPFAAAINQFAKAEQLHINKYMQAVKLHSPYRQTN